MSLPRLDLDLPPAVLERARRWWDRGEPTERIRQLLGFAHDRQVYALRWRLGWSARPAAVRRRMSRSSHVLQLEAEVQPLQPVRVPERRCTRCLGYTDTLSCHRCGATAANDRRRS